MGRSLTYPKLVYNTVNRYKDCGKLSQTQAIVNSITLHFPPPILPQNDGRTTTF